MTNEIEKKKATDLAIKRGDLFEAYGNEMTANLIEGTLLRFSKGDFVAGQEATEIPLGRRFVAAMDSWMIGWVGWRDNKPIDPSHMGLVIDAFRPPQRSELGDLDKEMWERDSEGTPRDPWQFTNYLVMREVATGEVYTFATNSKGGRSAIGELAVSFH
jgi:hypothetical protein